MLCRLPNFLNKQNEVICAVKLSLDIDAKFKFVSRDQEWENLRGLIGDTNKMKMRLKEKTATSISDEEFSRAREVLTGVDGLQIGRVSEVAETFYAWVSQLMQNIEVPRFGFNAALYRCGDM